MEGIKNIIIDLGGVVIDLDRERCVRHFESLGLHGVDSMLGLYRQEEPFLSVETGRISTAEFYDTLRRLSGRDVTDSEFEKAFESFLEGLPVERLAAIRRLRAAGYRTYMISNTNAVMYDGWIKRAFMQEGLRAGDYFDGIVTSFAAGRLRGQLRRGAASGHVGPARHRRHDARRRGRTSNLRIPGVNGRRQ